MKSRKVLRIFFISFAVVLILSALIYSGALLVKMTGYRHTVSLNKKARQLYNDGRYQEAEIACKTAITFNDGEFRKYNRNLNGGKNRLASYYESTMAFLNKMPVSGQILAFYEKHAGTHRLNISKRLDGLYAFFERGVHYLAGRSPFCRFNEFYNTDINKYKLNRALSLNNLGTIYIASGRYAEAEAALKESIDIYDGVLGGGPANSQAALKNLAYLYQITKRPELAKPVSEKILLTERKSP